MSARDEILYSAEFQIFGNDYGHGGDVAARIKAIMKELALPPNTIRSLSIANFEAEMNVIMYADKATLTFEVFEDAVRVTLSDEGPGIPDIEQAMQVGYSTATEEMRKRGFGAGLGLPNIKKNTNEFDIESTPGVGTTLRYGVFLS